MPLPEAKQSNAQITSSAISLIFLHQFSVSELPPNSNQIAYTKFWIEFIAGVIDQLFSDGPLTWEYGEAE